MYVKDNQRYTLATIRRNHPDISIPDGADLSHLGYQVVVKTPMPAVTAFQSATDEIVDGVQVWTITARPLAECQNEVWQAVRNLRDTKEQAGFPYLGHPIDSDPVSVQRIAIAVQAAQAALASGQPFAIEWKCQDDHSLPLDAAGMIGMAAALALFANSLHTHARGLKESIYTATTVDELAQVDIQQVPEWPAA